jgi:hypothetical protein
MYPAVMKPRGRDPHNGSPQHGYSDGVISPFTRGQMASCRWVIVRPRLAGGPRDARLTRPAGVGAIKTDIQIATGMMQSLVVDRSFRHALRRMDGRRFPHPAREDSRGPA